jgi:hypothetical protein
MVDKIFKKNDWRKIFKGIVGKKLLKDMVSENL